ncbi:MULTISPECIES: lysozyme inhibitor LprI family protein [unclassified Marinovum]
MKHVLGPAVLAATLLAALPALSTPSFPCNGRLTASERAICQTLLLGDLDRVMARLYYEARDHGARRNRGALQRDQALWLQWRDTCGGAVSCLRRRYEQRIIDLAPDDGLPPGFGCAKSPFGGLQVDAGLLPGR